MHETGQLTVSVDQFRAERDAIRAEIEARGYDERQGSYTRTLDGDERGAGLLVLPLYGYLEATHPRLPSTGARIHESLGRGSLLYRYEMGE